MSPYVENSWKSLNAEQDSKEIWSEKRMDSVIFLFELTRVCRL